MNENEWIDMISKIYTDLHTSKRVMHVSNESDKKRERISKHFARLEEVHSKVSKSKSEGAKKLLKSYYYDLYVIKPEDIPESYFENQKRIARERGYGNIKITSELRKQMIDQVIEDQKKSLELWIDYFLYDEESKSYGMWEKYWVFQGLQKLGRYDKEKQEFIKRDKTTIYPFPQVEREHVFTTIHLMEEYLKSKKSEEEIKQALASGNFKQLYEYVIKQSILKGKKQSSGTKGIWIKYDQGSDYNKLRNSLQGYYTGWCTAAGENFAKSQLEGGDFYVYYTENENHEYKIPRIAIRMDGHNKIGEIRGIANNQNMEPEMIPILNKKLEEFPDRNKYYKKKHDMLTLTKIDKKQKENIELSIEELKFLYEFESHIEGFGYDKDPRISEIKYKRNQINDLNTIFDGVVSYDGNLDLGELTSAKGLVLPKTINGNLYFRKLKSAKGLELPQTVNGDLYLNGLTSVEGLILPKIINGDLFLNGLTSTEGLELPQILNRDLDLSGLSSAEGLKLPKKINGNLNLSYLKNAEGLELPEIINGDLDLDGLISAKGLKFPRKVNGNLNLSGLISAEGLELPQIINGDLDLDGLTSAKGLKIPQIINGNIDLRGLTSAKGLKIPYGFNLNKLFCSNSVKMEMIAFYEAHCQLEEVINEERSHGM